MRQPDVLRIDRGSYRVHHPKTIPRSKIDPEPETTAFRRTDRSPGSKGSHFRSIDPEPGHGCSSVECRRRIRNERVEEAWLRNGARNESIRKRSGLGQEIRMDVRVHVRESGSHCRITVVYACSSFPVGADRGETQAMIRGYLQRRPH